MSFKLYSILGVFIMIYCFSCKNSEEKLDKKSTIYNQETVVKTVKLTKYKESQSINAIGIVISESESKPSFKTGGVIQKTFVKEGSFVKKGQLLATLVMDEINAQVKQAEEGFYKSDRDLKRIQNLYKDSVATLEQKQNVTTAHEVAKKTLEIAKFNQQYSEVRAPISGKIVKQIMKSGEIIGPGTPIYAIMGVGNQDWKIRVGLVDSDWARTKINDVVDIQMDAYPGKIFKGFVSEKSSIGGSASGTFDVEITFKSQPDMLAAGLTAQISIQNKRESDFMVIPIEALVRSNGTQAEVFVIENKKAKKLQVQIHKILGNQVSIAKGLEGVEEVITTGSIYLEEGESVKN
ncbi:MAG: efflux RND transporter periplasmic adaptor subunit [Saprospiraceae bacterium]